MPGAGYLVATLMAVSVVPAAAQGLSGPLASPDGLARPAQHVAARRAKAGVATKRTAVPVASRLPADAPASAPAATAGAKAAAPTDPLSFGMKWNGSNESAGQTRIDNLNGGAVGTGAEVGMKLHF